MANDEGFPRDLLKVLAAWALVHEAADVAWKGAVARGATAAPGDGGADGFVDALAALVDAEKGRLVAALDDGAAPDAAADGAPGQLEAALEAVRFELAEVRGRLESLQASVDALLARGEG